METVSYQNDSKSVLVRATPASPMVTAPPAGTAADSSVGVEGGQYHTPPPTDKDDQLSGALVCVLWCGVGVWGVGVHPHHSIRP